MLVYKVDLNIMIVDYKDAIVAILSKSSLTASSQTTIAN